MQQIQSPTHVLAELVATAARELGIETAVIGAIALAAHNHVRGTNDVDPATSVDSTNDLRRLKEKLEALGYKAECAYRTTKIRWVACSKSGSPIPAG